MTKRIIVIPLVVIEIVLCLILLSRSSITISATTPTTTTGFVVTTTTTTTTNNDRTNTNRNLGNTILTTSFVNTLISSSTSTTSLCMSTTEDRQKKVDTTPKSTKFIHTDNEYSNIQEQQQSSSSSSSLKSHNNNNNNNNSRMTLQDEAILFGLESDKPNLDSKPPFRPARHRKYSKLGNLLEDKSQPLNYLDHSTTNPLINSLRKTRDTIQSCPGLWNDLSKLCPNKRAILDENLCDTKIDVTYEQMERLVRQSASVFQSLGIEGNKEEKVAIFAENCAYWLMADHGLQMAGGVSAVRGADAPSDELRYIYEHSDSKGIVMLQNIKLLKKLQKDAKVNNLDGLGLSNDTYGPVKTILIFHKEKTTDDEIKELSTSLNVDIKIFSELLENTEPIKPKDMPVITKDTLSTIVYTSGTTGRPKGVMLTHGNLLHQLQHRLAPSKPYETSEPLPGETMLSLLPVWHITERTFELWMISRGCHVVYSTIRTFKNDLANYQPQWMVLVPRVLEKVAFGVQGKFKSGSATAQKLVNVFTQVGKARAHHQSIVNGLIVGDRRPTAIERTKSILALSTLAPLHALGDKLVWSKVKDGFGGRTKLIISGGSALSGSLEEFYQICGIPIVVGYGLTECSPLIAHRRSDRNLITAGCVGKPTMDTEIRIVDPTIKPGSDTYTEREALSEGEVGVVIVRGPQVMRGYYKNTKATDEAIDRYNWFDTGDLGRVNPCTGDIILTGRCKDTIVLSNGENIEPSPIEDSIISISNIIEQVMLTGQDGRNLVAIAVLNPTELSLEGFLSSKEGKNLQKYYDQVNDPQCTNEVCEEALQNLNDATIILKQNNKLINLLKTDISQATKNFRKWEQVGDILITLEPFAMVNGLLTQSYKVKRDGVYNKYQNDLSTL